MLQEEPNLDTEVEGFKSFDYGGSRNQATIIIISNRDSKQGEPISIKELRSSKEQMA